MAHRIRYALKSESFAEKMSGTIEADECFVGGVTTGKGTGGVGSGKIPVFAMVQRGGEVRSQVMPTVNGANLRQAIRDNVQICAEVHTDASMSYRGLEPKFTHKSVKHCAGEFSRHEGENVVTTAGVESFFSLLKRGGRRNIPSCQRTTFAAVSRGVLNIATTAGRFPTATARMLA